MKTSTKTPTNKIMDSFDNQLKNILMDDLKAVRAAKQKIIDALKQGVGNNTLNAA